MIELALILAATGFAVVTGWAAWVSKTLIQILSELQGLAGRQVRTEADVAKIHDDVEVIKQAAATMRSDVNMLSVRLTNMEKNR